MKFTTHKTSAFDPDSDYYWRATSKNGNIVASATGYNTRSGARKAARNFIKAVQKLGAGVVVDAPDREEFRKRVEASMEPVITGSLIDEPIPFA